MDEKRKASGFERGVPSRRLGTGQRTLYTQDPAGERWQISADPCKFIFNPTFRHNGLNSFAARGVMRRSCDLEHMTNSLYN